MLCPKGHYCPSGNCYALLHTWQLLGSQYSKVIHVIHIKIVLGKLFFRVRKGYKHCCVMN